MKRSEWCAAEPRKETPTEAKEAEKRAREQKAEAEAARKQKQADDIEDTNRKIFLL